MTSIMKDSQCGTYNYMAPEAIKSASPVGSQQEYRVLFSIDFVQHLNICLNFYIPVDRLAVRLMSGH